MGGLAPVAAQPAGDGVVLKLEHELTRQGSPPSGAPSPAARTGIDELNDQASAAENLARTLGQENREWEAELYARQDLISELEQTLAPQSDIIKMLEAEAQQHAPRPAQPVPAGVRTWRPAGWDPREFRWSDLSSYTRSPTAAESVLTVAAVLLLGYAILVRLRSGGKPDPQGLPAMPAGRRDAADPRASEVRDRGRSSPRKRDAIAAAPAAAGPPERRRPDDVSTRAPERPRDEAPAPPPDTSPPTVRLESRDFNQRPGPARRADRPTAAASTPAPTQAPAPARKRADPAALREVDALIAFEHFEDAAELLSQAMADNPDNPEYRLRSLYLRNALGDYERFAHDESVLKAMMDGPMSDTLGRVMQTGRGLLPDSPLFESKNEEGRASPSSSGSSDPAITLGDDVIDEFNESTFNAFDLELDDDDKKTKND